MHIIDLNPEHYEDYFMCLECWSDIMKESGDRKKMWFQKKTNRGLSVKIAIDDDKNVCGMIHSLPANEAIIEGNGVHFIPCVWVHGYKDKGIGNVQGKGTGTSLLRAMEEHAASAGAKGIAAWGLMLPFWMKSSWFKKHGYKTADKNGMAELVWKPFTDDAVPPRWIKQKKKPAAQPDIVTITAFNSGWCPSMNISFELAKKAVKTFDNRVQFNFIDTMDRNTYLEWGISDDIYIDTKKITTGPPLTLEKIKKHIAKRLKKL